MIKNILNKKVNTYFFKSVCVCVCVSTASRNTTVGATSVELQTHTFKDFSPLKEPH